jgi:MFS family permease
MQSLAQAWLVLDLSNSPFYLGLDGFAASIPLSVFAFWGGVIADRFNRRRLLLGTQVVFLGLALLLAVLTQFHRVRVWQIILLSFCTGVTQSIAWPVYQAVLGELVERKNLSNAIALNSAQFNFARTIGPLIGALGLSFFGTAGCFYANAVSFLAVIAALSFIQIQPKHLAVGSGFSGFWKDLTDGFRYMRGARALLWLLLTLAMTSLLGVPLVILLPVFARDILRIGVVGLGWLVGAFGTGAVLGGFRVAYLADFPRKGNYVLMSVLVFSLACIGFSVSHRLYFSLFCLVAAGYAMVSFTSVINTLVQTSVPDHLRGRAVSLFIFCFGGTMPFGNLLAGWMANHVGAPRTLLIQGSLLGFYTAILYVIRPEIRDLS